MTEGRTVLVCGGRDYANLLQAFVVLDAGHARSPIALIVHGACPVGHGGADALAGKWAVSRGIKVLEVAVNHAIDGPWPGAGPKRNARMLSVGKPDIVVAFPGGRGTADMKKRAGAAGVQVVEVRASEKRPLDAAARRGPREAWGCRMTTLPTTPARPNVMISPQTPPRCCRTCEWFDAGGEVAKRTAPNGDCLNKWSDRFTPEWDHVCPQWWPDTGVEP